MLNRAGRLTPEEVKVFEDIDAWYKEFLPEPPIYADGNPQKAIIWFKDTAEVRELVKRLDMLMALLEKYGVERQISRTATSGEIIYEDQFQVAVI